MATALQVLQVRLAVAHPLGVCLFLSLFAVPRRFSLQPSCHLVVVRKKNFTM